MHLKKSIVSPQLWIRSNSTCASVLCNNETDCKILDSFRFWDEDDYEYEIFSVRSSALAWANVILARKRHIRRHSTSTFSEKWML